MGGNVTALNKATNKETRAERVNLQEIPRQEFIHISTELFRFINNDFRNRYGKALWEDDSILDDGSIFNGSTSYIMNREISDEEILECKTTVGDIDIMVPGDSKEILWNYLDSWEGEEIMPGVEYAGCNKPTIESIGSQINSVFVINFGTKKVPVQVDFEFTEFENNKPTEWAKFSHSSSFDDAQLGIKAVHHKFLLRALIGGSSARPDLIICTPSSTPEKITLTKAKEHMLPRMLKFSVDRGIRVAYEPLGVSLNGKEVYRPIPTSRSTFITEIPEIYSVAFPNSKKTETPKIKSFIGIIELMKKYFTSEQIKDTSDRYIELLWGFTRDRGQELERDDPEGDLQVKEAGYEYFIKELSLPDERKDFITEYYKDYRVAK